MEIGKSLSFSVFCSLDVLIKTLNESGSVSIDHSLKAYVWNTIKV